MSNSATTTAGTTSVWIFDQGSYVFGPIPTDAAEVPNLVSKAFGYWVKSDGVLSAADLPDGLQNLADELSNPEVMSFIGASEALRAAGWEEQCPSPNWHNYWLPGQPYSATLTPFDHERFELRISQL